MHHSLRRLVGCLALASAALAPVAQASTVLDFNDPALTGVYFPDEFFDQAGFRFTQRFDAGTVDTGAALGDAAPTNNATPFYSNLNDGAVTLSRADGGSFSLEGFSTAYIPLLSSVAAPQNVVLVAVATLANGDAFADFFSLGDTSSTTSGSPFLSYADPAQFSAFTNLVSVDFFACAVVDDFACAEATLNNGQFALDDVLVTPLAAAVPEPTTSALMVLGLAGLVLVRRRVGR